LTWGDSQNPKPQAIDFFYSLRMSFPGKIKIGNPPKFGKVADFDV
jgi:hypothetical protein